jgi:tetratricopeptide (TPR) repeat protein
MKTSIEIKILSQMTLALLLIMLVVSSYPVSAQGRELAELQREFARHYLEPEPHMALAKYHLDHGNRIVAFNILEAARRGRFEEKIFNQAFYRVFGDFDNSESAEQAMLANYKKNPNDAETIFRLADIYISREDYVRAKPFLRTGLQIKPDDFRFISGLAELLSLEGKQEEAKQLQAEYLKKFPTTVDAYELRLGQLGRTPAAAQALLTEALQKFPDNGDLMFSQALLYQQTKDPRAAQTFVKAAALAPKSERVQMWAGRFFFKSQPDYKRALEYYLNAYFLNPHSYETEFVESRIPKIDFQLATEELERQLKAGLSLVKLLDSSNVSIVSLALEKMAEKWSPDYVRPVAQLLAHIDPGVRAQAMETLKTNVDGSFDEQLRGLLKDPDDRTRGLAAYIAVYRWKVASFGTIREFLTDESELVRFDALSALVLEGGPEGKKMAIEHAAHEPHPTLKKMILSIEASN